MKPGLFQQIILYRYRYVLGYTLFVLFGVMMMVWQIGELGPGLSEPEKASALASANWTWENWQTTGLQIISLPYILLQKLSLSILGLSTVGVRLPSVLIGLLTSFLFFWLMRLMHRSHIALATSVLFASSSWVVAVGHFGTPLVMTIFVWVLMAYALIRLLRIDDPPLAWAALTGIAVVLAFYTPHGIYALLAAILILAVHPKLRHSLSAMIGQQVALALFIIVPLAVPLALGLYKDYDQIWPLLGLASELPGPIEFVKNLGTTLTAFFISAPLFPEVRLSSLPLLNVGVAALFIAGLVRAVLDWRSVRTQFILIGFLLLLFASALYPNNKTYVPFIVPLFMLIASGVSVLFQEWYRLFPRNPYARSFGLVPIVIFLSFIVVYHYQQYFVAWANAPKTYEVFDDDITIARQALAAHPSAAISVPDADRPLYEVLIRKYPEAKIGQATTGQPQLRAAELGKPALQANQVLQPLANDDRKDSLRFWLAAPAE